MKEGPVGLHRVPGCPVGKSTGTEVVPVRRTDRPGKTQKVQTFKGIINSYSFLVTLDLETFPPGGILTAKDAVGSSNSCTCRQTRTVTAYTTAHTTHTNHRTRTAVHSPPHTHHRHRHTRTTVHHHTLRTRTAAHAPPHTYRRTPPHTPYTHRPTRTAAHAPPHTHRRTRTAVHHRTPHTYRRTLRTHTAAHAPPHTHHRTRTAAVTVLTCV